MRAPFFAVFAMVASADIAMAEKAIYTGTAFAVTGDGYLVTNNHVVDGCSSLAVYQGPRTTTPKLVAVDPTADLALLKISANDLASVSIRSTPALRVGEQAIAFGFPLAGTLARDGSLTIGNVSSLKGPGDDASVTQITTPIQHGNSGGPLLDASGNLIGVVVAQLDPAKTQNVNFAVELRTVARFLASNGVAVNQATSAATLSPVDVGERAQKFSFLVTCEKEAPLMDDGGPPEPNSARRTPEAATLIDVPKSSLKLSSARQLYPNYAPEDFQVIVTNVGTNHVVEVTVEFLARPSEACPSRPEDFDGLKKFSVDLPPKDSVPLSAAFGANPRIFCVAGAVGLANSRDLALRLVAIGNGQIKSKNFADAIQAFDKALELDPTNMAAQFGRSQCNIFLGKPLAAVKDLDHLIRAKADSAVLYYYRGWAYSDAKNYSASIEDNNRAIDLNPNFAKAYNNRAWANFLRGASLDGLPDAVRAVELDPLDASCLDTRAHILEALGDRAAAARDFRKAVELDPTLEESVAGMKRLKDQ